MGINPPLNSLQHNQAHTVKCREILLTSETTNNNKVKPRSIQEDMTFLRARKFQLVLLWPQPTSLPAQGMPQGKSQGALTHVYAPPNCAKYADFVM